MKAKEYRKLIQKSPGRKPPCIKCSNVEIAYCMDSGLKNLGNKLIADSCGKFNNYTWNSPWNVDKSKIKKPKEIKVSGKVVIKEVPEKLKEMGKW